MAIYKLNESNSFDDDQKIICRMAIDNEFISDMVDSLQYSNMLEQTDDGWAYMRSDYGGRDYFDDIPLEYIDEDEADSIKDYCLLDSDIEDYDWGEYSDDIEYVQELLDDCFIDLLIDYLNAPMTESIKENQSFDKQYKNYVKRIKNATTIDELKNIENQIYSEKGFSENDKTHLSITINNRAIAITNQLKFTESKKRRTIKESFDEQRLDEVLSSLPRMAQEGIDNYWEEPDKLVVYLNALVDVDMITIDDLDLIAEAPEYFNKIDIEDTLWTTGS